MSHDYETEQERLKLELEVLEESVEQERDDVDAVEQFRSLATKYLDMPELTPIIVNEYIRKIIVHVTESAPNAFRSFSTSPILSRILS